MNGSLPKKSSNGSEKPKTEVRRITTVSMFTVAGPTLPDGLDDRVARLPAGIDRTATQGPPSRHDASPRPQRSEPSGAVDDVAADHRAQSTPQQSKRHKPFVTYNPPLA